jgi:hypothetical protein
MTEPLHDVVGEHLGLGSLLDALRARCGGYALLDHWQQGEFHHDVVVRVPARGPLPGDVLVVATNCNGGVKEVLCFADVPARWALWHRRCPTVADFADGAPLPPVLAELRTAHWFDPCELLATDARSELAPACRKRARGGGWEPA